MPAKLSGKAQINRVERRRQKQLIQERRQLFQLIKTFANQDLPEQFPLGINAVHPRPWCFGVITTTRALTRGVNKVCEVRLLQLCVLPQDIIQ